MKKRCFFWILIFSLASFFLGKANGNEFYTQIGDSDVLAISSVKAIEGDLVKIGDGLVEPNDEVFEDGLYMVAPEGNNLAIDRFLVGANGEAETLRISFLAKGQGRLSVIYGQQSGDQTLGIHFDVNGKGEDCVFYATPAGRYVNDDGVVEIHITVSDGQELCLGTITVKSLAKKPPQVRVIKTYDRWYPPSYQQESPTIFYAYYAGPYYVYRSEYTYVAYVDWWSLGGYKSWCTTYEPIYVVHPVRRVYYYSQPDVYREARCATASYYNDSGYLAPSKVVKVREWQESRRYQRTRSVASDTATKRSAWQNTSSLRSDEVKWKTKTKATSSSVGGEVARKVVGKTPNGQPIYAVDAQAQNISQQKVGEKQRRVAPMVRTKIEDGNSGSGNGIFDRVKTRVKSSVERVIVVQPQGSSRNSSGGGESIFSKRRADTPRDNTSSLSSGEVKRQPQPQATPAQNPQPQRQTRVSENSQNQSSSTKTDSSSSSDDDEQKKKRRDR